MAACASSRPATTSASADPTCAAFEPVKCDVFITEATFGLPVFRHPDAGERDRAAAQSAKQFPERAHLVGAYALGKAQRVMRLLRDAGYDRPIYIHGALAKISEYYQSEGIDLGQLEAGDGRDRAQGRLRRRDRGRPAIGIRRTAGRGAFPIRSRASPPAGCASASAPSKAASSCR